MQKRDEAEKKRAESESLCGRAVKDHSGKWIPVEPIFPDLADLDYEPPVVFEDDFELEEMASKVGIGDV